MYKRTYIFKITLSDIIMCYIRLMIISKVCLQHSFKCVQWIIKAFLLIVELFILNMYVFLTQFTFLSSFAKCDSVMHHHCIL